MPLLISVEKNKFLPRHSLTMSSKPGWKMNIQVLINLLKKISEKGDSVQKLPPLNTQCREEQVLVLTFFYYVV